MTPEARPKIGAVGITRRRALATSLALAGVLAACSSTGDDPDLGAPRGGAPASPNGPYLLATFDGDIGAHQSLFTYWSHDGKDFLQHDSNPVYVPASGRVRDPSLLFLDGTFYVAHTLASHEAQNNSFIGLARSSRPLSATWTAISSLDFSSQTAAGVPPPQAWAPEFFVDSDGAVYLYLVINEYICYVTRAENASLTAWAAPSAVTISGLTGNAIDHQIVKLGSTYHMVYKNAQTCTIDHATASSPLGPFTVQNIGTRWTGFPSPTKLGYEGPSVVQIGQKAWRMYVDNVGSGAGISWSETVDPTLASGWSTLTPCTINGEPNGGRLRHGTAIRLTGAAITAAQQ